MRKIDAVQYLTTLHKQYGQGQGEDGKRTIYGLLASAVLRDQGLPSNAPMGMWMSSLAYDSLGLRRNATHGVVAVANRLQRWLAQ